ncbi:Z ring-associated protein ZapA [Phocoenobacter uteri]|uniref:Cell division protein ZapA n=1 Tax=Phocoenobacter uteri TaxID=146806 RepID=A0A379C7K2_9PAST|nr:cell division protein ZapA [Phocoenobacter uteri]MDG6882104.1 cell division protein ZapA [Phocoenobacter uteri]SUB58254.1 Z ring-associated protein ZapA [Phocoenobacter uteri]
MPKNNIEIQILGQSIKLYCPEQQQESLFEYAQLLEERVAKLKQESKIIQLEKILTIVALNLQFELAQEKEKSNEVQEGLVSCLKKLDSSLGNLKFNDEEQINP